MITDGDGQVLLRAEDPSRWGDSLSGDVLVRRALLGSEAASVEVLPGIGAPSVTMISTVPIMDKQQTVGSVSAAIDLNQAFVDGLKSKTGLQSSVYGGDTISATTFLAADSVTHLTGTRLVGATIKQQVLNNGSTYSGDLSLAGGKYLGAIVALKDVDNVPVGMLLVAQPQSSVLRTAGRSVELTFALTSLLLVLCLLPAYFVTKGLVGQLGRQP